MTTLGLLVFAIFSIVFFKFVVWFIKRRAIFSKIEHLPGPKAYPLIGNAFDIKSCEDLLPVLMRYQREYGMTHRLQLGPDPHVFTSDPKLMEALTSSSTQITKSKAYEFLNKWIGNGLVSANNPRWRAHRRMISPSFHFNILKDFLPVFFKNQCNLVEHWKKEIGVGNVKEIDVFKDISSTSLDIICETAMGTSVNALKEGEQSNYMKSVRFLGRTVIERTFSAWMRFDCLYRFSKWYKYEMASVGHIKDTTGDVIKRKRTEVAKNNSTLKTNDDIGAKKRMAFLDFMMTAEKENGGVMTDEELREEVDTLIFAGHDTTAATASFVLYYLATNPDVQQKVYDEIISVTEEMSYEQLNNLKYLDMVIKETMRIMPTIPMIIRLLTDDVVFNGHHFPKGLNMACFIYGAHRNPDLYEDPEKFIPERFTLENVSKRHPFAYLPFSAGPRNCIGQKFAMLNLKSMISTLVRHFKFSKSPNVDMQPIAEGIMKSMNGIQLRVESRS